MRLQSFYRLALVLPLIGLALAAAVKAGAPADSPALAHGGRATWMYPPFAVRGLLAYGVMMIWLNRELGRRSPKAFESLLWVAPVVYTGLSAVLLGALVLLHGEMADFVEEHRGWIGLRLATHLIIGYAYLGLVILARNQLRASGYFADEHQRSP
jgi:hypothetical protein